MNHGKTPVDTLSKPDNTASTPNPIPAYLIVLGLSKEEAFYKAPDGTIIKRYHLRILYVLIQYRVAVKLFRVEETR